MHTREAERLGRVWAASSSRAAGEQTPADQCNSQAAAGTRLAQVLPHAAAAGRRRHGLVVRHAAPVKLLLQLAQLRLQAHAHARGARAVLHVCLEVVVEELRVQRGGGG